MNNMSTCFVAEKQESVIFVVVDLLAIGFSLWLWMNGHRLKSMAYPLVMIALMQIVVGSTVYLRIHSLLSTLSRQLQAKPAALKAKQTARMEIVMKNFSIHKAIEMRLLIMGAGMIAFFPLNDLAAGYWRRTGIAGGLLTDAGYFC